MPLVNDLIVEMRAAGAAGLSALGDAVASLYLHAFDHLYGIEMGVDGLVTEPVVYCHGIAVPEELELTDSTTPSPVA